MNDHSDVKTSVK